MELNIIIFIGILEGPDYYTNRFIEYIKSHSINYYIVNARDPSSYNNSELDEFASRNNVVMFTFNNIGLLLFDSNGEPFWNAHKIPVFDYIVDHPRYYSDSMLDPVCDLYVFAPDKDHCDYIKRFYSKVKGVFFSPNGGTEMNNGADYIGRTIDVIYMGDCNPKNITYPIIDRFQDNGIDFYSNVSAYLYSNPHLTVEEAITWYLNDKKVAYDEDFLFWLNTNCAGFIEKCIRRRFKLEGMKALDEAGIHVDVYGTGWQDEDYPFTDNITLHGRIKRYELMNLIGKAKISLCFIPWFKNGCSEKNFDSMLNRALCVTDKSGYLSKNYKDGYNIIYFDLNNPRQMAQDIKWLLDNPDKASIIAMRGYETAKKYDDWICRFDTIIEKMFQVVDKQEEPYKGENDMDGKFDIIEKEFAQLKQNQKVIYGQNKELIYSDIFHDTIKGSKWLPDDFALSPGNMAMGYPALYVLYRILDEFKPHNILEIGLGQSTKLIAQYSKLYKDCTHQVVEHDQNWIDFFKKNFDLPKSTTIVDLPITDISMDTEQGTKTNVTAYVGFAERFDNQVFDFICIDGPFGFRSPDYARIDIVGILPECIAESFVILLDDCHRKGESNTFKLICSILDEHNIPNSNTFYSGEKTTGLITSPNLSFLCSM